MRRHVGSLGTVAIENLYIRLALRARAAAASGDTWAAGGVRRPVRRPAFGQRAERAHGWAARRPEGRPAGPSALGDGSSGITDAAVAVFR